MDKKTDSPSLEGSSSAAALSRRETVKAVARLAIYVAPAMAVLISGDAEACHKGTPHGQQTCMSTA